MADGIEVIGDTVHDHTEATVQRWDDVLAGMADDQLEALAARIRQRRQ